jgi:hypothetical protein
MGLSEIGLSVVDWVGLAQDRPLRRPRHRWIDSIKMGLSEIGLSVVDWIGLAQDRYR